MPQIFPKKTNLVFNCPSVFRSSIVSKKPETGQASAQNNVSTENAENFAIVLAMN